MFTIGNVGVKQCMHSFHSLDCLLSVFFDDYMSKLFPIFYLANFVCFYPSKYKAFPPNINYITHEVIDPCTCRDKKTCPLQEKCMTKDIVYKATITTSNTNSTKHYIGMTASTFKERYRNHIKSFNHKRYSNDTELSKYIWKLKDNKQDFDITWSVLKQSISYTGGSKRCNLCLEEKLCILKDKNKQNLLNKKSEIVSTCNHRKKHLINNLRNGR